MHLQIFKYFPLSPVLSAYSSVSPLLLSLSFFLLVSSNAPICRNVLIRGHPKSSLIRAPGWCCQRCSHGSCGGRVPSGPVRAGRPSGTTGAAATAAQRTRAVLHLFLALRLCSLTALRAQRPCLKPGGKPYSWLPRLPVRWRTVMGALWYGTGDV